MKVALIYDRVNKIGGAERILLALHQLWPEAPLYTAVYNRETAPWAKDFKVIPSFLQKFPFAKANHEFYPWITPLAFESFDFSEFNMVISITSAEAKGIITKPKTLHICYCLTPTRYLWSGGRDYPIPVLLKPVISKLRIWDQVAAQRPDIYLAISKTVAERIKKYYRREAEVIYPPVDTNLWQIQKVKTESYFLVVSRLVPYKRVDLVISAFNKLGWPLKIVGTGREEKKLKMMAKKNIQFLGQLTDRELLSYYQKCQALIFPQEEDFGLAALEAQSCGKPVIAYKKGGALETIIEGKTGEFFSEQKTECLIEKLKNFKPEKYSADDCRMNALRFDEKNFQKDFKRKVLETWEKWKITN